MCTVAWDWRLVLCFVPMGANIRRLYVVHQQLANFRWLCLLCKYTCCGSSSVRSGRSRAMRYAIGCVGFVSCRPAFDSRACCDLIRFCEQALFGAQLVSITGIGTDSFCSNGALVIAPISYYTQSSPCSSSHSCSPACHIRTDTLALRHSRKRRWTVLEARTDHGSASHLNTMRGSGRKHRSLPCGHPLRDALLPSLAWQAEARIRYASKARLRSDDRRLRIAPHQPSRSLSCAIATALIIRLQRLLGSASRGSGGGMV